MKRSTKFSLGFSCLAIMFALDGVESGMIFTANVFQRAMIYALCGALFGFAVSRISPGRPKL